MRLRDCPSVFYRNCPRSEIDLVRSTYLSNSTGTLPGAEGRGIGESQAERRRRGRGGRDRDGARPGPGDGPGPRHGRRRHRGGQGHLLNYVVNMVVVVDMIDVMINVVDVVGMMRKN